MPQPTRLINHIETVYRPGERDIARDALEVLGCRVIELQGFLFGVLDPDSGNGIDNAIYSSEVTPEQWQFEEALAATFDHSTPLGEASRHYREQMAARPQYVFHFGIAFTSPEAWEEAVARIDDASWNHPTLAGRIEVAGAFRPGDAGSMGDQLQAFIHTDALSSGLLSVGQQIELQYTPASVYAQMEQLLGTATHA